MTCPLCTIRPSPPFNVRCMISAIRPRRCSAVSWPIVAAGETTNCPRLTTTAHIAMAIVSRAKSFLRFIIQFSVNVPESPVVAGCPCCDGYIYTAYAVLSVHRRAKKESHIATTRFGYLNSELLLDWDAQVGLGYWRPVARAYRYISKGSGAGGGDGCREARILTIGISVLSNLLFRSHT